MNWLVIKVALFSVGLGPASGVVISSVNGSGNTTAPGDDPGFGNVGARGSASGVYLGNRWVLTANHVGAGAINLGGSNYGVLPGSAVRIQNPTGSGLTTDTDLIMYRLNSDPGLPALSLATSTPTVGTEVVMAGNGFDRAVDQTMWDVTVNPTGDDTWTVTTDALLADVRGWATLGSRNVRWGENQVAGTATVNLGPVHGQVLSIFTVFDEVGLTHEGQGANGDSGGAFFWKEGGDWKLGGIMNAVGTTGAFPYDGRPDGESASNPYPYFGRATTAADLSEYREQIEAVVATPEPSSAVMAMLALGLFGLRRRS